MDRKITGTYGEKRSYYPIGKFHEGVDLAYGMNEPIKAYGSGKVSFVGYDPKGYGNYLKVTGGDGSEHLYAHANNFNKKMGDLVALEEVLGLAGSTGRSTGPHLHFGVYRNGKAVDPMGILNGKKDVVTKVLGTPQTAKGDGYDDTLKAYVSSQVQKPVLRPKVEEPSIESLLQKTMTSNLANAMTQKEKPQFTSIEDIFNAPKGQKLNKFAEFARTPMALDVINGIVSLVSPTGRYGGSTGAAAQLANEKAVAMGQLYKKIDEENKEGIHISKDVLKELGEDKRESLKMAFAKDKFTQEQQTEKEKFEYDKERHSKEFAENVKQFGLEYALKSQKGQLDREKLDFEKSKPKQSKTVPADKVMELSGVKEGLDMIHNLQKKTDALPDSLMTPGVAQARMINPWDTDAQGYQQYIATVKQVIGKGLEGGVLRAEDERKYEKIIPKVGDTRAILKKKNDQLQEMLSNKYATARSSLGEAGYDISGLSELNTIKKTAQNKYKIEVIK